MLSDMKDSTHYYKGEQSMILRKALILFYILFLLILNVLNVKNVEGFEYESDKRVKEQQQEINTFESRVGRKYWILPNDAISFDDEPSRLTDKFHVTDATSFTVIEWIHREYDTLKYLSLYKVEFASGKVAYIDANNLDEDDYWFKEYIRTDDPEAVEAKLREEAEQRRVEEEKAKQDKIEKIQQLIRSKIGEKLPPNYKGNDFQKIYMKYFKAFSGKKEFEKTQDYTKRLQSVNIDEIYAFRKTDKDNMYIIYDPDNEVFEISIYTSFESLLMYPKTNNLFVLKTTDKKTASYMGSNAFGAKVAITKHEAQKYGVQLIGGGLSYDLHIPMSISDAKKYKESLSVLLICKPYIENDTLAFMGSFYDKPTFDDPLERSYRIAVMNVELLEIWVYDFNTGKVFHKQSYM